MIQAIIEIPQGSYYKYEVDKKTGELTIDRPLNQPIPYNYGFIPDTLCGDGDPLDVFVMTESPIIPLTKVKVIPVAILKCIDNGDSDDKVIAILEGDNFPERGTSIISTYLRTYKTGFEIKEILGAEQAMEIYEESKKAYIKKFLKDLKASADCFGIKTNE